jgi:nitroreductase
MKSEAHHELLEALKWRYATKVFDPTRKIPADLWQALLESVLLTPSSYGLQPYRLLDVVDAATRAALLPHSWNQHQVVDASHLIVFTARTTMTRDDAERLIRRISEVRRVSAESLNTFLGMMMGDLVEGPRRQVAHEWAARQAYIALGNLLTSAAVLGVDACPLEGFVPAEYDRLLKLAKTGYTTVVACALGYRAATDKYSKLPKVRFEQHELIQTI